jgi:hypothetical protein
MLKLRVEPTQSGISLECGPILPPRFRRAHGDDDLTYRWPDCDSWAWGKRGRERRRYAGPLTDRTSDAGE